MCAVLSPKTLAPMFGSIPTREGEGQEHPEQTGERHEAWVPLHECAQFCLKLRVQCLWVPGSTYTYYPVPVWLPQTGSGGCRVHKPRGLCTDENKSDSPQAFTLSTCLSLVMNYLVTNDLCSIWKGPEKSNSHERFELSRTEDKQVDIHW